MTAEDSILVSELDMAGDGEGVAADTVVRDRFPFEPTALCRMVEANPDMLKAWAA